MHSLVAALSLMALAACGGGGTEADLASTAGVEDRGTSGTGGEAAPEAGIDTGGTGTTTTTTGTTTTGTTTGTGTSTGTGTGTTTTATVHTPIPVSTSVTSADATGGVSVDSFAPDRIVLDGALGINDVMYYVTVNGITRPLASGLGLPAGVFTDGPGNLYGASFSGDGQSFAVVGFTPDSGAGSGTGGQFVGGYFRGTRGAPTGGSAQYRGIYEGYMIDAASPTSVIGSANFDANFDAGTFEGLLSRRSLGADGGLFNPGTIEADVTFAGTIDGLGRMRGGHLDADSIGSFSGQAHANGVVGVVEVTHSAGGTANAPSGAALEVGTLYAE